jgi:hypothetical protein
VRAAVNNSDVAAVQAVESHDVLVRSRGLASTIDLRGYSSAPPSASVWDTRRGPPGSQPPSAAGAASLGSSLISNARRVVLRRFAVPVLAGAEVWIRVALGGLYNFIRCNRRSADHRPPVRFADMRQLFERSPMANRRKGAASAFVPLFILMMGFAALINTASRPTFKTFRSVDVVSLVAAGMCFGAAIAALAIFFGRRHSD